MPRMYRYRAEPDRNCYPCTTILINRLGSATKAKLAAAFEAEGYNARARQPHQGGRLPSLAVPGHPPLLVPGDPRLRLGRQIRTRGISKCEQCRSAIPSMSAIARCRALFTALPSKRNFRGLDANMIARKRLVRVLRT